MVVGLVCSAAGFAFYPFVREPWQAFAVAVLAGSGVGVWFTMQSSVLALITPSPVRHAAFAQQRVAANIGLGLGGVGGLIVTVSQPATFTLLSLLNATTFLVYTAFLIGLRAPRPARPVATAVGRGYRGVLSDGAFMRLAVLNLVVVIGAISLLTSVFPVYAKNEAGVSETMIGTFFLLNSITIIVCQLPIARAVEGRRRMAAFALMGVLFAASWVQVGTASSVSASGLAILALASGVFTTSLAECLYAAVQGPLAADLAPADLLGRYMAVMGFSWQVGFIAGPALGAALLAAHPPGVWYMMATVCRRPRWPAR
jgi:MFS family permease